MLAARLKVDLEKRLGVESEPWVKQVANVRLASDPVKATSKGSVQA